MPDLTESGPERLDGRRVAGIFPVPRTLGSFVILVTILAFIAGKFRNELALTLLGTVFLTILAYCFFAVLIMGIIHRSKAKSLSMRILSETAGAGKEGELLLKTRSGNSPGKNYFWKLPAVLIRLELSLETRDGRVIRHYINPETENYSSFAVKERGAYYGERDRLVIFDAPLFFRLSLPLGNSLPEGNPVTEGSGRRVGSRPRLLAIPCPVEETIPLSLKSGGTEQRNEPHYRKSDELIDHRPYVPGDDPRRINWKLYSHAPLGDLFVREGESEPPPHSRLLILIDTGVDPFLYTVDEGRRSVDLLCESALAAALEFSARGMDICIGYSEHSAEPEGQRFPAGGRITGGCEAGSPGESRAPLNAAELASALAWPAAIFGKSPAKTAVCKNKKKFLQFETAPQAVLPAAPGDRAVLILALPGNPSELTALDVFIKKREARQQADIVFLYDAESLRAVELEDAARACVNCYNKRSGIHAEKIAVRRARERGTG